MDDTEDSVAALTVAWPSVDDISPDEEGGPIARTGFNYQDEIAVSFLIDMLGNPSIIKIHLETHDDLVIVREQPGAPTQIAEYVQVKGSEKDQLWSVATLCQQNGGKSGSSLFETSLGRDRHAETSRFRIATLRPVNEALRPLTYACGTPGRALTETSMKELKTQIDAKYPKLKSSKGSESEYWLEHCLWDERHDEPTVQAKNLLSLIQLAAKEGRALLPEQAELILLDLRAKAK